MMFLCFPFTQSHNLANSSFCSRKLLLGHAMVAQPFLWVSAARQPQLVTPRPPFVGHDDTRVSVEDEIIIIILGTAAAAAVRRG